MLDSDLGQLKDRHEVIRFFDGYAPARLRGLVIEYEGASLVAQQNR